MDAEKALLSKVAQTGRGLSELVADGIASHHFDDETSAAIWDFMIAHDRKYGKLPSFPIILERFPDYNFEVSKDAIEYIKDRFLQGRERRLAMDFSKDLARACNDPEYAGRLGELILERGRDLMMHQPGNTVHRFTDMDKRIKSWHDIKAAGGHQGIKMGIPAIDNATLGIQPHEFVAIVGWQGMGKSTLAQWIVFNAFGQDRKTLFISLEMGHQALYRKWDTMAVQFESYTNLKQLTLGDQDLANWKSYAEKLKLPPGDRPEGMRGDILALDDVRDCTVEKIHAEINRHKPDLVVIDYLTLMHVPKMGESARWEKMTWLSRQLKQMALTLKTPIIGLAQTDRSSAKEGARLDNIGASYSIGADADVVLGLNQDEEMRDLDQMEIKLIKNRDGEIVSEKAYWEMKRMRFVAPYTEAQMLKWRQSQGGPRAVEDNEEEEVAASEQATGA